MNIPEIIHQISQAEHPREIQTLKNHPHLIQEFLNAIGWGISIIREAGFGIVAGILDGGLQDFEHDCTFFTVHTTKPIEQGDIEITSSRWSEETLPLGSWYEGREKGPGGFVFVSVGDGSIPTDQQRRTLGIPPEQKIRILWNERKVLSNGLAQRNDRKRISI